MAARYKNITENLKSSWTIKLNLNADNLQTLQWVNSPVNLISGVSLLGNGTIINYDKYWSSPARETYQARCDPVEHLSDDPGPNGLVDPNKRWYGLCYSYTIRIGVADAGHPMTGITDEFVYYIWMYDIYSSLPPLQDTIPSPGSVLVHNELSVTFETELYNFYPKGYRDDDMVPSRRQLLDFTDQSGNYSWYGDEFSRAVTRAIHPEGTLSVEGYPYGTETEMGLNPFRINTRMYYNYHSKPESPIGWISDLKFGDYNTNLDNCVLYSPGTDIPDSTNEPTWGRTDTYTTTRRNKIYNDSGITMTRIDGTAGTSPDDDWRGVIWAPQYGTIKTNAYQFDTDVAYTDVVFESPEIVKWDGTVSEIDPWTGNSKEFYRQSKSWEFPHEIGNYNGSPITVRVQKDWRDDNDENVGEDLNEEEEYETLEDINDQTMIIYMYPINTEDFTNNSYFWPMFTLEFDDEINLLVPPTLSTPPSLWIGTNCSVGSAPNYNNFTVASGQSNVYVVRNLLSRFEFRMDRLNDHLDDPEAEHLIDWIWLNKSNVPIDQTLDDPDWWDSLSGGVDAEDIRDLSNRGYLLLDIDAPKAETLTLELTYDLWSHSSPYYTCFSYTFGSEGEHESIKDGTNVLQWTFDVEEGNNLIQLDIQCSDTMVDVVYENCIKHATQWKIVLPDNSTGADELWTINHFKLVLDTENTSTLSYRYKRPHSWLNKNWFGFGLVIDGVDAGYMDYGYSIGTTQQEPKFLQSSVRRHCPNSVLTDLLDYAKDLSTLVGELNWQEGIEADWNDMDNSLYNKDDEDDKLTTSFYWWDLAQQDERSDGLTYGAVGVKKIDVLGAIEQNINSIIYIKGKMHGIAKDDTTRIRNQNGVVEAFYREKDSVEPWNSYGFFDTDSQGRYKTGPVKEMPYEYKIGEDGNTLNVINRSYTTSPAGAAILYYDPHIIDDSHGNMLMAVESDGTIYARSKSITRNDSWSNFLSRPFQEKTLYRPSICSLPTGQILVSANDGTDTFLSISYDYGRTWTELDSDMGDDIIDGTLWHFDGQIALSGSDGTYIKVRVADMIDLENKTIDKNVTLGDGRTFIYTDSQGKWWIAYDQNSDIIYYYCDNISNNFVLSTSEIGDEIVYGGGHFIDGEHGCVGSKANGDGGNDILFRSSTRQTLENDMDEILVESILLTEDQSPKSCINLNNYIIVVGSAGRLRTYRLFSFNDGFEQIC